MGKGDALTASEWDERRLARVKALRNEHVGWTLDRVLMEVRRETERLQGTRPVGLTGTLIDVAWQWIKSGGDMPRPEYDWKKTAWKGIKTAALGALVLFLVSFDTPQEWVAMGLPAWSGQLGAVIVGSAITMLRNAAKHKQNKIAIP